MTNEPRQWSGEGIPSGARRKGTVMMEQPCREGEVRALADMQAHLSTSSQICCHPTTGVLATSVLLALDVGTALSASPAAASTPTRVT